MDVGEVADWDIQFMEVKQKKQHLSPSSAVHQIAPIHIYTHMFN